MNGEEVARELINVLSVNLGVQSHLLLGAMRDRGSVNNVAMRVVRIVYPSCLDICCFSHILDIVGEKFKAPVLNMFSSLWLSLFHTALKLGFSGRNRQENRWPHSAKPVGGVAGKFSNN